MAAASMYPVSDASDYWICSSELTLTGNFFGPPAEWCQRRPIYAAWLGGLKVLTNQHMQLSLLLQAVIVTLSMLVVVQRCVGMVGLAAGTVAAACLVLYARQEALAVVMTENAGLLFGCLGLSLLLAACGQRNLRLALAGIAALSCGLNARAGALFVLPALVLWFAIIAPQWGTKRWIAVPTVVLAATAGFALQAAVVLLAGGDPNASHGNFAYVLYGLAAGGKGWSHVLAEYPALQTLPDQLRSARIMEMALQEVWSNPAGLVRGLWINIETFIAYGTIGVDKLGLFAPFYMPLWLFGLVVATVRWRDPTCLLLAAMALGSLASVPLLMVDGGPRIFAATVPADVVLTALGTMTLARLALTRSLTHPTAASVATSTGKALPELALLLSTALLLAVPFTPLRTMASPTFPGRQPVVCAQGEFGIVARIGRESPALHLSDQPTRWLKGTGEINREAFLAGVPAESWWRDEIAHFQGASFLRAYQVAGQGPYAPGPVPVYSEHNLAYYHGKTVSLCIEPDRVQQLFGTQYQRISAIRILQ